MGAQLRVYRRRIRSVQSTKKITKAMELIAASRIAKARSKMEDARPYAEELTRALAALGDNASLKHPMLTGVENPSRAGVLVVTSDRGLAGGYNANVLKQANELGQRLEGEGKQVVRYVIGRKGVAYYKFRNVKLGGSWTGFSEQPNFLDARAATEAVVAALVATSEGEANGQAGIDELYVVYTRFVNSVSQTPAAVQVSPVSSIVDEGGRGQGARTGPAGLLRVRAGAGGADRRPDPALHQRPDLLRAAGVGGVGVGRSAAGDEVGQRQRHRADQDLHPAGQPGPAGRDHPGDQRDRRRRRRAGLRR